LGVLFSNVQSKDEIPFLLNLYEKIRRSRAEKIQKGAYENADIWHMPDGDDQIARDIAMRAESSISKDVSSKIPKHLSNPNQWSDGDFQPWLFGHNAITHAEQKLAEARQAIQAEGKQNNGNSVDQTYPMAKY
jgi:salicylate hydroxylase